MSDKELSFETAGMKIRVWNADLIRDVKHVVSIAKKLRSETTYAIVGVRLHEDSTLEVSLDGPYRSVDAEELSYMLDDHRGDILIVGRVAGEKDGAMGCRWADSRDAEKTEIE